MKKGWDITTSPINSANWMVTSGNRRVVRLGGGVGRIMRLGFQLVNITAQFYGSAVPSGWGFAVGHAPADSVPFPRGPGSEPGGVNRTLSRNGNCSRDSSCRGRRFPSCFRGSQYKLCSRKKPGKLQFGRLTNSLYTLHLPRINEGAARL